MIAERPNSHAKQADSLLSLLSEQSIQFEYVSGGITTVKSGAVVPWRTLPESVISQITGGIWRVERDDGTSIVVRPEQTVCIPPGVRHRSFLTSDGASVGRWVHFNIRLFGFVDVFTVVDAPQTFSGSRSLRVAAIIESLMGTDTVSSPVSVILKHKALKYELAAIFLEEATFKHSGGIMIRQLERIFPVLNHIHKHLGDELCREDLAAIAHLSPSRFAGVFKEALGISAIDFVINLRMQRARELLIAKDLGVGEIAADVGYADAAYFSRLFKKHYGLSPAHYRTHSQAL